MLATITLLACAGTGHSRTPPAAEASLPPRLDTAVPEAWRCAVAVEAVLADHRRRGHPDTPAHRAWVAGLSAEEHQMYTAESHGEGYRECSYRVTVLGQAYRYTTTWSTTLEDLPEGWCQQARVHVAAEIQRTTHGCADLHRGAYYGHDLTPLPAPAPTPGGG